MYSYDFDAFDGVFGEGVGIAGELLVVGDTFRVQIWGNSSRI
jgi:hypothetical protein